MANQDQQSQDTSMFRYKLTFGNTITEPGKDLTGLTLYQGTTLPFSDGSEYYNLTLMGVKVNKKIYQPCEIQAELFIMQQVIEGIGDTGTKVPSFKAVSGLLLRRQVKLEIVGYDMLSSDTDKGENPFTVAENCYVYALDPQLKQDKTGTKMFVKLNIFSVDKLMTLNKYSKAYVARKLGSTILKPESLQFGKRADGETPLIKTDVKNLRHLRYSEKLSEDGKATIFAEFIQPYLVQYNESFYDFLVRTSNRCGEFLYFEDGVLTLGLPKTENVVTIKEFESVVIHHVAGDPLDIKGYARDSIKSDADKVGNLNHTVIEKESTGFPVDAFPKEVSANAELASDEYFFPLFKDKFTTMSRETKYDSLLWKGLKYLKNFTMGDDVVVSGIVTGVTEGLLAKASSSHVESYNKKMDEIHLDAYKDAMDQYNKDKVVQFGSLDKAGWTTIDYYNDIHKHEAELQRQIICINMGTKFAPVKLGQKIKVGAMDDSYIVIQIQLLSDKDWENNYDKYGETANDCYSGSRQQKIYAIPTLTVGNTESVFPPVHPVPVIRKSGPQTAFVTDNDDPKYQSRVRVAFTWQTLGESLRAKLKEADQKLKEVEIDLEKQAEARKKLQKELNRVRAELAELKRYVEATPEEREAILADKNNDIANLEREVADLQKKQEKMREKGMDQYVEEFEAKITSKQEGVEMKSQLMVDMEEAAKEHDTEKDTETYKDIEKDNTVVSAKKQTEAQIIKDIKSAGAKVKVATQKAEAAKSEQEKIKTFVVKKTNDMATPWIRVATPMATPGGGTFFKPQIGDEVLINFECDNMERPYVVGSLFSKNTLDPAEVFETKASPDLQFGTKKQVSMTLMSPNGHHISFTDPTEGNKFLYGLNPGTKFIMPMLPIPGIKNSRSLAGGIHIGDRYGVYEIEMSTHTRSISISSPLGTVDVNAFTGITINAPNGDVTIRGKNVSIEARNQLSIVSGTNIKPPSIGDPDYACGTPVWHELKGSGWWGPLRFFANLGRGIRYGFLFLGHQILKEGLAAANEQAGPALFADLSLVRHMFEISLKPINGTMLIKSRRYLMLEAGSGVAKVKHDRFPESQKIDSVEKFFIEFIAVMRDFNERIENFFLQTDSLWNHAIEVKTRYRNEALLFLKNPDDPDIITEAFNMNDAEWNDETFGGKDYMTKVVAGDVILKGVKFEGLESKDDHFRYVAIDMASAVHGVHKHVLDLVKLLDDYADDNTFKKSAKDAFKEMAQVTVNEWKSKYGDGQPNDDFLATEDHLFKEERVKTLLKRKATALYMLKVSESQLNEEGKFLTIGYSKSDIVDKKVKSDYNWKNFMTHFDHKGTHGNKALIYLLDGLWEPVKKKWKNPFGVVNENEIWEKQNGQILISDNDGATLHIEGENLKSETQSNLGNREQLMKLLLAIK